MRIYVSSIFVDDQDKALEFYTTVLGFVKKTDLPAGDFKWLTVASPEEPEGVELLLEPNATEIAKVYQRACRDAGIPATSFAVEDVDAEYERLKALGVTFKQRPTRMGEATVATFDDTCGNLIQIVQV